jgi:hypothetical protein
LFQELASPPTERKKPPQHQQHAGGDDFLLPGLNLVNTFKAGCEKSCERCCKKSPESRRSAQASPEMRRSVRASPEVRHSAKTSPEVRRSVRMSPESRRRIQASPDSRHAVQMTSCQASPRHAATASHRSVRASAVEASRRCHCKKSDVDTADVCNERRSERRRRRRRSSFVRSTNLPGAYIHASTPKQATHFIPFIFGLLLFHSLSSH